jgi:hypothetical protein
MSTSTKTQQIPFNQLKEGDKYTHTGPVSQVVRKEFTFITIRRADDWLVTSYVGDWVWDRFVKVVTLVRE